MKFTDQRRRINHLRRSILKKAGKVTYTNKKLKKEKTYYKVRAYIKSYQQKKVYGKFSTIKIKFKNNLQRRKR